MRAPRGTGPVAAFARDLALFTASGVLVALVLSPRRAAAGASASTLGGGTLTPYAGSPHDGEMGVNAAGQPVRHYTPAGPRVAVVRLPPRARGDAARTAWVRAVVPLVQSFGLSLESALLFVAHLARETGFGWNCWCFAFGNIKATGWGARPWFRLDDHEPYRAYPTARDGMSGSIGLIRDQANYRGPWAKLMAGDVSWYGDLGRAGYYESDPAAAQAEYSNQILPEVRRRYAGA